MLIASSNNSPFVHHTPGQLDVLKAVTIESERAAGGAELTPSQGYGIGHSRAQQVRRWPLNDG